MIVLELNHRKQAIEYLGQSSSSGNAPGVKRSSSKRVVFNTAGLDDDKDLNKLGVKRINVIGDEDNLSSQV